MLKGVFFDLDGVIIDTERDGHRVAFNQTFSDFGIPDAVWDVDLYHQLLQTGGGKERIRSYFTTYYHGAYRPEDLDSFVKEAHRHKTDLFLNMLPALPLRPGVRRFMAELREEQVPVGICTTSNERVAQVVADRILAEIPFAFVIAGDMVKRKKPDPEIYQMALELLHADGSECLVVEDSHIGVSAAKGAGCRVLSTYNPYTQGEDLSAADCIVSCLGDPFGEPAQVRKDCYGFVTDGLVRADIVKRSFMT